MIKMKDMKVYVTRVRVANKSISFLFGAKREIVFSFFNFSHLSLSLPFLQFSSILFNSLQFSSKTKTDGGDWNPYRLGQTTFFGPGSSFAIDSTQPMTVVTQFLTDDNTDNGDLTEINRFYIQNGKRINSTAWKGHDSITDSYIEAAKIAFNDTKSFEPRGGMKRLGDVMDSNGFVLVMSVRINHFYSFFFIYSFFSFFTINIFCCCS